MLTECKEKAPLIDWPKTIKLMAGKEHLAKEMMQKFIESLHDDYANLQQAYGDKDWAELQYHVHRLHGACCYFEIPHLKMYLVALNQALKIESQPYITSLYPQLCTCIESVIAEYEANDIYHG